MQVLLHMYCKNVKYLHYDIVVDGKFLFTVLGLLVITDTKSRLSSNVVWFEEYLYNTVL